MKRPRIFLSAALIATLSFGSAHADTSETGRVTTLIVEGNNVISINLSGTDSTGECSGGARWTITPNDPLYIEKYATILAAAQSGQEITLVHLSSNGCGFFASNKVYYVQVNY